MSLVEEKKNQDPAKQSKRYHSLVWKDHGQMHVTNIYLHKFIADFV